MSINTKIIKINPNKIDEKFIKTASNVIKKGGIVAFPTETVYGLGACVYNKEAIDKIFIAKGRPNDNPLIVHISDLNMLKDLVDEIPNNAKILMEKFWPGPLTIIFPKSNKVNFNVTANLDTVAIRFPRHPIARKLIELSDCPIAAPSANTSTKPSPTHAQHVVEDLNGKVDVIIDGGNCDIGLESTVVKVDKDKVLILRPGGITKEDLSKYVNTEIYIPKNTNKPLSPGMKYRHYSPKAKLILIEGDKSNVEEKIEELIFSYKNKGMKVGVLIRDGEFDADLVLYLKDKKELAKHLFSSFRTFDKMGIDIILMEDVSVYGIGLAIRNRIEKAAYKKINV